MSVIYTTYDNKQKDYLNKNGCEDILTGRNIKSNKRFWVFERTKELNDLLKKWKTR